VHIYAGRWDEIWTDCFFSLTCFFFLKGKAKDVKVKLRIEMESVLHRPSINGTKLFVIIKAIIIIHIYMCMCKKAYIYTYRYLTIV